MLFSIVIVLIIALVIVAVVVNAMQQAKERQETERRAQLTKYKTIIEETEEVLMNSANVPISLNLTKVLHKRVHDALEQMVQLSPNSNEIKTRLKQSKERQEATDPNANQREDKITMPESDAQIINIVQGIKKLRAILRSEHSKGNVDPQVFMNEDRRMESLQLQINVDSQIKRGVKAKGSNMLGSARQYFEKALQTLENTSFSDEFISTKTAEVKHYLEQITMELKNANARDAKDKEAAEQNELDVLFAPKKKW